MNQFLNTPVLFIIFNRAVTTRQVFEAIRQAKPKQLFVAADGPRPDKEGEKEKCNAARAIATAVDWDCEVKTFFREENRGCGRGPAEAITWFFENVEQGIILEDDCLPDPSFFNFCEELLNYYADNEKIMHISGNNFQFGKKRGKASYYFSKYTHNWGWATWRRAWKSYQFKLNDIDDYWESFREKYEFDIKEETFWKATFDELYDGKEDVWDGQWVYTVWKNQGVSILPNKNLISNIGFGGSATHTFQKDSIVSNMAVEKLGIVKHTPNIKIDVNADKASFKKIFLLEPETNIFRRLKRKIRKAILKK